MSTTIDLAGRLKQLAPELAIEGELVSAEPYGNGHINDTLLGIWSTPQGQRRCVHQRLNHVVFPDLDAVMSNVALVCDHLAAAGVPESDRLSLVRTRDGVDYAVDADGRWWRTYPFVEGTVTRERVSSPDEAAAAGTAFGRFLGQLADLPGERVREVIPGFHDTPLRIQQLDASLAADAAGRAQGCRPELAFVDERRKAARVVVDGLADGSLPLRITHNDTKLNNVLLDAETLAGRCVIDLDTLMPGSALYDLGDLLRTSCSTGAEDDREPERIDCDLAVLRAAVGAFAGALGDSLSPGEAALMPIAGSLITFECGTRFLADHLAGDTYFKTHRPDHNLQRARAQFALAAAFERRRGEITDICGEVTR